MKLSDVIHLYLGCEVRKYYDNLDYEVATLVGVTVSEVEPKRLICIVSPDLEEENPVFQEWYVKETKPELRRLSSMTEEEVIEFRQLLGFHDEVKLHTVYEQRYRPTVLDECIGKPIAWHWLLSKHFDLFGLIDSQQAIEK